MGTQETLEEVGSRLPPTRERTGKLEHRPPSRKLRSSPDQQMRWRSPRFPRSAASRLGALALCGLAIGVAALAGCGESAPPSSGQPTFYQDLAQTDAAVDAAVAQSMISGYRSNNGLGPVVVDPDLMRLAGEQARAMAARDKMDHDVGRPFHERMRKAGVGGSVAVENVGAGYHTLAEAFSGWRDSPPHRANMLNRGVTRMGIATAYAPASKYKVFWALILAGPDGRRG
jgi:uncharacterized protein YkwD